MNFPTQTSQVSHSAVRRWPARWPAALAPVLSVTVLSVILAAGSAGAQGTAPKAAAACLTVKRVELQVVGGALPAELSFVKAKFSAALSGCLTDQVLSKLLSGANNALIGRGYLTSRLSIPQQNISSGTLRLTLTPGRIEQVVIEGGLLRSAGALSLKVGALLRVRDLDQSVETLNRLSSVQATTRIEPGRRAGYSVVRLQIRRQGRPVSGSAGVQARPYQNLGAVNASVNVTVDNPLRRADQLRLSANLSPGLLGSGAAATGGAGFGVAYSLPYGRALYSLGGSYSASNQARAGFSDTLNYRDQGWNIYAGANWNAFRSGPDRTDLNAQISYGDKAASLNGTEITVQRARVLGLDTSVQRSREQAAWRFGVQLGNVFEFRSNPLRPGLAASSDVVYGNVSVSHAFAGGWTWRSEGEGHYGLLTPQAQPYTISGATLRGAGAAGLSSDHGFTVRNALYVPLPLRLNNLAATLYGAADYGFVTGSNLSDLPGQQLLGAAFGVQGQFQRLQYDLTLGYPVIQPPTFRRGPNVAFSLRYLF